MGVLDPWVLELVKHMTDDARKVLRTADVIFGGDAAPGNGLSAQQRANQVLFGNPGGPPPIPAVAPAPPGGGQLGAGAGAAGDAYGEAATKGALADEKLADVLNQIFTANDAARQKIADIRTDLLAKESQLGDALADPAALKAFEKYVDTKLADVQKIIDDSAVDAATRARVLQELRDDYRSAAPNPGGPGGPAEGQSPSSPGAPPPESSWHDAGPAADSGAGGGGGSGQPSAGLVDPFAGLGAASLPSVLPSIAGLGSALPAALGGLGGVSPLDGLGTGFGSLGALGPLAGQLASRGADSATADAAGRSDPSPKFLDNKDDSKGSGDASSIAPKPSPDAAAPATAPAAPAGTSVALPDGSAVSAPTPQAADAVRAALRGISPADAYRAAGIALPPPGTPVTAPVDPSALQPGDIAQFTDKAVMVVGNGKLWLDGQVQPVSALPTGPDFLGWMRPTAGLPVADGAAAPRQSASPPAA